MAHFFKQYGCWLALVTQPRAWECPPKVSLFHITRVTLKTQSVGQSDDAGAFQDLLSPLSNTFSPSHYLSVSRHHPSIVSHPASRLSHYLYFSFPLFLSSEIPPLENTQPSSWPSVTQEGSKRGSSKRRVRCVCNRRTPVKGRVMSLAFGRLWRCSLVSYQTRLTKTLRMPDVSWVSFFSYKECAKNSPIHTSCFYFPFVPSVFLFQLPLTVSHK